MKKLYSTPVLSSEELLKADVLTSSNVDNHTGSANDILNGITQNLEDIL
jgi:hypothetical protein